MRAKKLSSDANASSSIEIRSFKMSDLAEVLRLNRVSTSTSGTSLGNGPWDEDLRNIPANYGNCGGEFIVGCDVNKLVTLGAFKRVEGDVAEITRLKTHPDYQKRGLAEAVYTHLERVARAKRYKRIVVEIAPEQEAAHKLFLKLGFCEISRNSNANGDSVRLEKNLA